MDTGNRKFSRLALLALLAVGGWSCGRSPLGTSLEQQPASVVLELREAPADVECITVTIATSRQEQRRLDVPADGPVSFVLQRLPLGLVVFSAEAHPSPCASLAAGAEATWTGGPVSATLKAGPNGTITIQMVPAVRAGVTVSFADGGVGPTCAAAGAACASGADCCPGAACVLGAEGLGRCQLAVATDAGSDTTPADVLPDNGPPGVALALEGSQYYIVYPPGGPDCARASASGQIYTATVSPGEPDRCVPNGLGALVPVPVRNLQVCTPGGSCAPCTGAACLPSGCFPQLPPPSFLGCGASLRSPTGPDPIVYLLIQDFADSRPRAPEREGLPMVLTTPDVGPGGVANVLVRPPAGYGPIVVGNLNPEPGAGGDSCDANSMCGVLPLWGVSSYSFVSWNVFQSSGRGLSFWSF